MQCSPVPISCHQTRIYLFCLVVFYATCCHYAVAIDALQQKQTSWQPPVLLFSKEASSPVGVSLSRLLKLLCRQNFALIIPPAWHNHSLALDHESITHSSGSFCLIFFCLRISWSLPNALLHRRILLLQMCIIHKNVLLLLQQALFPLLSPFPGTFWCSAHKRHNVELQVRGSVQFTSLWVDSAWCKLEWSDLCRPMSQEIRIAQLWDNKNYERSCSRHFVGPVRWGSWCRGRCRKTEEIIQNDARNQFNEA